MTKYYHPQTNVLKYYFAVLTSGVVKFDAMPKARIEEIKSRSEAVDNPVGHRL